MLVTGDGGRNIIGQDEGGRVIDHRHCGESSPVAEVVTTPIYIEQTDVRRQCCVQSRNAAYALREAQWTRHLSPVLQSLCPEAGDLLHGIQDSSGVIAVRIRPSSPPIISRFDGFEVNRAGQY